MSFTETEKIAAAVLYEGYILYPYRANSLKNVQRWNFGTLYPQDYAIARHPAEPFCLRAECLVELNTQQQINTRIDVRMRFLHLARQHSADSAPWDVGVERTVELNGLGLAELASASAHRSFTFAAGPEGAAPDTKVEPVHGACTVAIEMLEAGVAKLSVEVSNTTSAQSAREWAHDVAMLHSFVSAHVMLHVTGGMFVSLLDTPEALRASTSACRNQGVFPVLVGSPGERTSMLCSPIILYDYPHIAPESRGDYFDGTEMDEMLALRVLTLTEEEKREMRLTDDRSRRILERTETLPEDHLSKLHGAIRGMRAVPANSSQPDPSPAAEQELAAWDPMAERPAVDCVRVFGVELRAGSRVRLWPQKKADIMDMALEGKVALIEAIEQDYEDHIQLAVVVDDDPGREFGMMRQPGHRFFFAPEEVEPILEPEGVTDSALLFNSPENV